MAGYFKYISIYKTTLIDKEEKIILDPVTLEIFKGPRTYKVPHQDLRILPAGEEVTVARDSELSLAETDTYITLTARTKEINPFVAKDECRNEINKILVLLSLTHGPSIFNSHIYSGWIEEGGKVNAEAWVMQAQRVSLDKPLLLKIPEQLRGSALNEKDQLDKFTLMSKFYNKSLLYDPGEEKFLFLWTILEVFPMEGSTSYSRVNEYLSHIIGLDKEIIRNKLNIADIYRIRSKLVHAGKFTLTFNEISELISKVESIVRVVMRDMAGFSYDDSLKEYLK